MKQNRYARVRFPSNRKRIVLTKTWMTRKLKEIAATGHIFKVVFIKRTTGEKRVMVCRGRVKKGVKGVGLAFEPNEKQLLVVYDMQKQGYRMIPYDRVTRIVYGGRTLVRKK